MPRSRARSLSSTERSIFQKTNSSNFPHPSRRARDRCPRRTRDSLLTFQQKTEHAEDDDESTPGQGETKVVLRKAHPSHAVARCVRPTATGGRLRRRANRYDRSLRRGPRRGDPSKAVDVGRDECPRAIVPRGATVAWPLRGRRDCANGRRAR